MDGVFEATFNTLMIGIQQQSTMARVSSATQSPVQNTLASGPRSRCNHHMGTPSTVAQWDPWLCIHTAVLVSLPSGCCHLAATFRAAPAAHASACRLLQLAALPPAAARIQSLRLLRPQPQQPLKPLPLHLPPQTAASRAAARNIPTAQPACPRHRKRVTTAPP